MISLKNVRVRNLKGIDLDIPTGKFVVFTGVSGSGKSSIAFDTIYIEGQRRYIESLPHQARRQLADFPKPDAESITGLWPTIAIEQKTAGSNPRSNVATMTGIYDFLRVLFAKIATPYCPVSQEPVKPMSFEKIAAEIQGMKKGAKITLLAPFVRKKKGEFQEELLEFLRKGFFRVKVDGDWLDLNEPFSLDPKALHDIDILIDRFTISKENSSRILESIRLALDVGKGILIADEKTYSQSAYSEKSGLSYEPLQAHDFSFNHPSGMCPDCKGLGKKATFHLEKVIDSEKSIEEDCCSIASSYNTVRYGNIYRNLAKIYGFSLKKKWSSLPEKAKKVFLYGTEKKWTKMRFVHPQKKMRWTEYVHWRGVIAEANERVSKAKSASYKKKMEAYMSEGTCPHCMGSRLRPYPSAAKLAGKTLQMLCSLSLEDLFFFFQEIRLNPLEKLIADDLVKEIQQRLSFLIEVGLGYLSLDRTSPTLSGGESQRVRLASSIGSSLVGVIYVLDEPSIGLHPLDHHKLIDTLKALRDQGNSVLVVEHDLDTILAADLVIDVGPKAGIYGGEIIDLNDPRSITGRYLSKKEGFSPPKKKRKPKHFLKIQNANKNNLKGIDVKIPLGVFTAVTGVSGSGKSTLVSETLVPLLKTEDKNLLGIEHIDKVIEIDQSPIGRTPRSNPATYTKLFDDIRDLFAELPESKMRGFGPGEFSFNVKKGSCPYCSGMGEVKIDMDFMEDVWIACPQCKKARFEPEILAVQFKGKSIRDILDMSIEEAASFFENIPKIRKKLQVLQTVGLGYLSIGQSSTTLSGGEAQRIKLSKELSRPSTGNTIYILDEPTTGLHFHDVKNLIAVLNTLVENGNTVLVIEHNMDLIQCSDWIIDLGPGAGIHGGQIVGQGPLEKIQKLSTPTALALSGRIVEKKASPKLPPCKTITVEGASQNNLKNISLEIPRGKIIAFTGPSGSGKSSMAIDTLYAEGQRRYSETLSAFARSQIKQMPKPKVEKVTGLSPAIALEQKTGGLNPRSTIGTITEIYDLLRVLYAHMGEEKDPETHEKIEIHSKESILEKILQKPLGEKIHILTPVEFERKETFPELLERLQKKGFLRIRLNKTYYLVDEKIPFDPYKKNELLLVIDRLTIDPKNKKRIFEALSNLRKSVIIAFENQDITFHLEGMKKLAFQNFSFNHELGMCPECQGLGETFGLHFEVEKDLEDISPIEIIDALFKEKGTPSSLRWVQKYFKKGKNEKEVLLKGGKEIEIKKGLFIRWLGIEHVFAIAAKIGAAKLKEALRPWLKADTCKDCKGARLNARARHVFIENTNIYDLCSKDISKTHKFIEKLKAPSFLQETHAQILSHLEFLLSLGLHYLELKRSAPTLSGGELQRIRLAKQLGSGLSSCIYVLDEPTIGLHPYNNELLNSALIHLRDLGNTIILVEHDPMTIERADYLIDFGPKAGKEGGTICAQGSLNEVKRNPASLTGAYLSGKKKIPRPAERRKPKGWIPIENANLHNLKNISVKIPRETITCFSGVSGSGKSSLINYLYDAKDFEKIIRFDQNPIGQTSRADVSTYSDIQPLLRAHFAMLPSAKAKGLQPKHFSPNHIRGMCRSCWGLGKKTVYLQFLPPVCIPCDGCKGARLNPLSLEVEYKGKHFGQILQMSVLEALDFFACVPKVAKKLELLLSVGLSYLPLGQELASLSGGEAQRLRLCKELSKRQKGEVLYLIDEPTIGLHPEDVLKLLKIFHRLADHQNTLVIIEHNIDIIKNADYLIDLGPGAGEEGGLIVDQGTPEEVCRRKKAKIASYLSQSLHS